MKTSLQQLTERYGLDGASNILADKHFGIVNGHLTAEVWHSNVINFRSLYAPPFASSNFVFDSWVAGESVKTTSYSWMPYQIKRQGVLPGLEISSVITLIEGERALVLEIKIRNTGKQARKVPLQFDISGGLDYPTEWNFAWPEAIKPVYPTRQGDLFIRENDTGMVAIGAKDLTHQGYVPVWETALNIEPGQSESYFVTLAMGYKEHSRKLAQELLDDAAGAVQKTDEAWAARATGLLGKLPRLTAADKRLERFYDRSALHFLLNQWQVDEFLLHPYYSTGSINGGCIVSYLWDFGEGWEMFSLVDPDATREHIKTFLATNLMRHFAFNPISGAGWGPWYMINQEKIIFHIYFYVLQTGDVSFLHETVKGKTILELVSEHALYGDDLQDEANLLDYGAGNHHLELRRQYRYDHIMPDLNARRYPSYYAAATLFELAGKPAPVDFRDRAEKLKVLIHDKLWSEADQWWWWLDPAGGKHINLNMQLFKLIGGGAISETEEKALVDRINEKEFLSEYGMHSMSKLDVAYDQIDIDNGGGGAYTGFPPQIIERLYKAGYTEKAEDVLHRILWWADRCPYWGDSLVANYVDYRKDTPLQSTIGSVSGAQAIIFGMFGAKANADGTITVNPVPPSYSCSIALHGLKLRGKSIDIEVENGHYKVTVGGDVYSSAVGQSVVIPAG